MLFNISKQQSNQHIMENLTEQVAKLLDEMEFCYDFDEGQKAFFLGIRMDNTDVDIVILADDETKCLYNKGRLTLALPEDSNTDLLYKINEIHNRSFSQAHLYIDENDNRLTALTVIDIPESEIVDADIFERFLYSTAELLDDNFNDIMSVAFGQKNDITK